MDRSLKNKWKKQYFISIAFVYILLFSGLFMCLGLGIYGLMSYDNFEIQKELILNIGVLGVITFFFWFDSIYV